jgi:uncharacterized membrane protein
MHKKTFRWTAKTGITPLNMPGNNEPVDVTGDGSQILAISVAANGRDTAYLWTQKTGAKRLTIGSEAQKASVRGMTQDGKTFVGVMSHEGHREAFRWKQGESVTFLTPGKDSIALFVSNDGAVISGYQQDEEGPGIFRWTEAEGAKIIAEDERRLGADLLLSRMSTDGAALLGMVVQGDRGALTVWEADGTSYALGELPGQIMAYGVDACNEAVVGYSINPDNTPTAFIWSREYGMLTAKEYLTRKGVHVKEAHLSAATGISGNCKAIVGYSQKGKKAVGWIAHID